MGEWHEFARLQHFSNHYRLLMLGTFEVTVVFDLTVAVEVGLGLVSTAYATRWGSKVSTEAQKNSFKFSLSPIRP